MDRSDTSHTVLTHSRTDGTPPVDRSDTSHTVLTHTRGQNGYQSHCSDTHLHCRSGPVDRSAINNTFTVSFIPAPITCILKCSVVINTVYSDVIQTQHAGICRDV